MAIPFDPKELVVSGEHKSFRGVTPLYTFPVSRREAYVSCLRDRKPIWQLSGIECKFFLPRIIPDNKARALVMETRPFDNVTEGGGLDMFGIPWEYVPVAQGSMEVHGSEIMDDANDWPEKVVWPDIDSWDWEGSVEENKDFFNDDMAYQTWFQTGWFERLISLMGFENAAMALIDEEQEEAVLSFFDKLADLYCAIIDKFVKHFPKIDLFYMHDDWGSQKETFFSPDVVERMIVPSMKKVTDYIHSIGKIAELHSCGQIMRQVPNMIKAGWDTWSGQSMNDTRALYEQYGDQIIIGVHAPTFDPETTSEEEQRQMARDYAAKYCNPKKPSVVAFGSGTFTNAYREELYKQSRMLYAAE